MKSYKTLQRIYKAKYYFLTVCLLVVFSASAQLNRVEKKIIQQVQDYNQESIDFLEKLVNINSGTLNRLLSKKQLNRILSASQTLVGDGLEVNTILQKLFDHIFATRTKPDSFERALQLNFITQIKSLVNDEELHPEIKASLKMLKKDINKWSKSKRKISDKTFKAHFYFCYGQTKVD